MRSEAILASWAWTTVIVATSTGLFVGGTPGSNQSICRVWVNLITNSSTRRSWPIVRETGMICVSRRHLRDEVIIVKVCHLLAANPSGASAGNPRRWFWPRS